MARQTVEMKFLSVAEAVFSAEEFQLRKKELHELGISMKHSVMPMLQLIVRTAALEEKPHIPYRQIMRHRALLRLMNQRFSAESILTLIRQTKIATRLQST